MQGDHIRLGAVNYLNTKPLVYGLDRFAPQAEVIFDLPSRLADRLAAGELDVALIPSIEFFQNPQYSIVSDACIACRGPVLSVKLFSRVPAAEIRTLALDEGSRTSAALTRILLKERFDLEPRLEPLAIGATLADTAADAVLLIGDRAIQFPARGAGFQPAREFENELDGQVENLPHGSGQVENLSHERFAEVWDLGDEWSRWAELPFVFAMWTARPGVDLQGMEAALGEARDAGVAHLAEIAAAEAAPLGLTVPQCLAYLRDHLYFYLGPREQRGLQLYYEMAARLGLAPVGLHFGLDACKTAG